jgi:hypothetical protein
VGAGSTPGRWRMAQTVLAPDPALVAQPAQLAQLTVDATVAPGRVLPGQPHHQRPKLGRHSRATAPVRVPPAASDQIAMPAQQRLRLDGTVASGQRAAPESSKVEPLPMQRAVKPTQSCHHDGHLLACRCPSGGQLQHPAGIGASPSGEARCGSSLLDRSGPVGDCSGEVLPAMPVDAY